MLQITPFGVVRAAAIIHVLGGLPLPLPIPPVSGVPTPRNGVLRMPLGDNGLRSGPGGARTHDRWIKSPAKHDNKTRKSRQDKGFRRWTIRQTRRFVAFSHSICLYQRLYHATWTGDPSGVRAHACEAGGAS